jgi:hypothetical protein
MTNNNNGFLTKIINSYKNHGPLHLLDSGLSYMWRLPLYQTTFITNDEVITDLADNAIITENPAEVEFMYNGIWEPPHPPQITDLIGKSAITSRSLYNIKDVSIIGSRPFILNNNRIFAPSNIGTSTKKGKLEIRYRDVIQAKRDHDTRKPDIEIGFLLSGNSPEFAHWATEILTKLRYYEMARQNIDGNIELVVCPGDGGLSTWKVESLEVVGYPREEYYVHDGTPTQLGELIIPSNKYLGSFSTQFPSPDDLRWVRERAVTTQESENSKNIYISRRDANRRRVRNEDEVESVLSEFGFETFVPGKLPYKKQVSLFSGADIIVGSHGAGMMNALFNEGGTLIELMAPSRPNSHHFCLSNLISLNYEYVPAQPVEDPDMDSRHYDIVVDCGKLETALESVI